MKITKDMDFIIMACDGVWDCVDIQKLCEHISLRLKSHIKISDIIAELFDQIISKTNNSKNILT
jgi:protein phosphatase 2C family protein 2/3